MADDARSRHGWQGRLPRHDPPDDLVELLAMTGLVQAEIVPGATHLFEEAGTLAQVALLATRWFQPHLRVAGNADVR